MQIKAIPKRRARKKHRNKNKERKKSTHIQTENTTFKPTAGGTLTVTTDRINMSKI
jgi:hypothetical protein